MALCRWAVLCLAIGCLGPDQARAQIGAYALDELARTIPPTGKVRCPRLKLTRYEGDLIKYAGALTVHAAFRERLARFEALVQATALEMYGRAPRRITHLGSYKCRRIHRYPDLVSEHGLGNAIDVSGFDFGPLPRGKALPVGVPKRLRRGFSVRILDHWSARGKLGALHSRFLRRLARRLIERRDIFRVLLGPAWPGHDNHFHFDMSNYRLVAVFQG